MMRWDIINHLIKKNNYRTYLEIGYYKGWSFDKVECGYKIAVDPNPCKTPEQERFIHKDKECLLEAGDKKIEIIWKQTSDEFFSNLEENDKYSIIFIDGLHEANQVLRDIENSLKHLSPGGVIVLHDCNPPKYEHTTTGIDGCWTGDTYKAFIKFQRDTSFIIDSKNEGLLFNGYQMYTVDTDWGVGVIKPVKIDKPRKIDPPSIRGSQWDSAEDSWEYFDKYRQQLLNLITPEEFLKREN